MRIAFALIALMVASPSMGQVPHPHCTVLRDRVGITAKIIMDVLRADTSLPRDQSAISTRASNIGKVSRAAGQLEQALDSVEALGCITPEIAEAALRYFRGTVALADQSALVKAQDLDRIARRD